MKPIAFLLAAATLVSSAALAIATTAAVAAAPSADITGTVDGEKVTFVENLNYQGQVLAITYTGQIVSAAEIKFTRDVGGQGGEAFTAKRQS